MASTIPPAGSMQHVFYQQRLAKNARSGGHAYSSLDTRATYAGKGKGRVAMSPEMYQAGRGASGGGGASSRNAASPRAGSASGS